MISIVTAFVTTVVIAVRDRAVTEPFSERVIVMNKGFLIEAMPYKDGAQWQLAGRISKDGREHKFVRADKFSDQDECADIAISKGQLIVDQSGERIFG